MAITWEIAKHVFFYIFFPVTRPFDKWISYLDKIFRSLYLYMCAYLHMNFAIILHAVLTSLFFPVQQFSVDCDDYILET